MTSLMFFFVLIFNTVPILGNEFKRVCYFTNWSNKRPVSKWNFQLVDIDPSLCTHIVYAFVIIDTINNKLIPTEIDDDNGKTGPEKNGRYYDFTNLKKINPNLVTMLSVGGARHSESFINVSASGDKRRLFARNCVTFLRDRNFDGLDVDWEYPSASSKNNFTLLLKSLREEFERESKRSSKQRLILTAAVGAGKNTIENSYNVTEIVKYLDFINVMTYDYFGSWSKVTGWSGPLFSRLTNQRFDRTLSQDWTIHKWIQEGAPPEMLILGITGKGISFELKNPDDNGVGVPVNGSSSLGAVLPNGQLTYFEVCRWLKQGATVLWDDEQKMNYAFNGNIWVGYESERSIIEKVKYARRVGLSGIMFWSFDLDDFYVNLCSSERFPLLKTIKDAALNTSPTNKVVLSTTQPTHTVNVSIRDNGCRANMNIFLVLTLQLILIVTTV